MIGSLPESLAIGGVEYGLRSDYRNVLQVFEAFSAEDLPIEEKWIVTIKLLIEPFQYADDVFEAAENGFDVEEAIEQINWFISAGKPAGKDIDKPVYDWSKDEQMIFSAVNKVAGQETRELEYLHWWTFLGWFNEVGEGTFSFIAGIRNKRNHNKKLEKHEQEFYNKNKDLVDIKPPMSKEEKEAEEAYKAKIKRVLGI